MIEEIKQLVRLCRYYTWPSAVVFSYRQKRGGLRRLTRSLTFRGFIFLWYYEKAELKIVYHGHGYSLFLILARKPGFSEGDTSMFY